MSVVRMIRPLDFSKYPQIPEHTQGALKRYVEQGLIPGSFLYAVLTNDLHGAIMRADPQNLAAIKDICQYVCWEIPDECRGNSDKVYNWVQPVIDEKMKGYHEKANGH